jgi:hypothetical protein
MTNPKENPINWEFPKGLEIVYNKYVSVKHGRRRYSSWITKELKIETVTASEKDHNNRPLYLIDGKEDTFWSGEEGSWIQADLGLTRLVYGFEIHWLKGSSEGSGNINHFTDSRGLEEKMNAEETKPEEYRGGYYVTISYFIY